MDLVEDNLAGTHAVSALGVVGSASDHALVFPPLDQLLGMVVVAVEFLLLVRVLQRLHDVLDGVVAWSSLLAQISTL